MAYVPVPKDMTIVKTKIIFNLTKRQLICFGAAAAIGIPTYFLARGIVGNSVAVLLMIALMLPAFFMAMYEKDGRPAEKILFNILRARWFSQGKRPYKTENLYEYLENQKEGQFVRKDTNAKPAAKPNTGKAPAKKAGTAKR